jgi:hypothetical protein
MKTLCFKKFYLVLLALEIVFFSSLFGQENEDNKNHIGINLFAIRFISEDYASTGYKNCLFNGIYFKHDIKDLTIRYFLSYNAFNKDYIQSPNIFDGMNRYNKYSLFTIGSGIQKNLNYKKNCFFYGLDIFSDFSKIHTHVVGGIAGINDYYNYYHLWLGIRPFVGLKYQIVRQMSISIESNYNLAYRILNTDKYINSVKSFQTYFNPINTVLVSYDF